MEFRDIAQEVFSSYGRGAWAEALQFVHDARQRFPERDSILTFWEACLLSLHGEPEHALDVLENGLGRGHFWDRGMLADPDLGAARELGGWSDFEARSAATIESLGLQRPGAMIREADNPVGSVLALHGAGDVPEDFFAEFGAATPPDWTFVAPVGDVPVSNMKWAWPYDLATDSLLESLQPLVLPEPIVVTGYSQGARLGAKAAWNGLFEVSGLILSAPAVPPQAWSESKQRPVPLYAVVGTEDLGYEVLLSTCETLERDGIPFHLDIREGMGHVPPDDLDLVIRDGLEWIASQTPR